jgi:hypothetical protein
MSTYMIFSNCPGHIADIVRPSGIDLQLLDSDGNVWELIQLWLEHGMKIYKCLEGLKLCTRLTG